MKQAVSLLCFLFLIAPIIAHSQATVTWSPAQDVAVSTYGHLHPRIVTDRSGDPLVIWGRAQDGAVHLSRWNGSAFSSPLKLNPAWLNIATASWMGPAIASFGDTVYVVVKRTPEYYDTSHVYILRSFDGGNSFGLPVRVDNIADSVALFPSVDTDSKGHPVVGFMKLFPPATDHQYVVSRSWDFGSTFGNYQKASGWTGGEVCDCCPPQIVVADSVAAMIYRANIGNIRDTWVGISRDTGTTFTAGWNVANQNWNLGVCPSSGPDGVIVGDTLYSVFLSAASGSYRVYWSKSSISAQSAGTPKLLYSGTVSSQNYPRIAKSGTAVGVAWRQVANFRQELILSYTPDVTTIPMTTFLVDSMHIVNTDLALFDDQVFVVWQDDNSGTVKFRKGTVSALAADPHVDYRSTVIFPNPFTDELKVNLFPTGLSRIVVHNLIGEKIFDETSEGKENVVIAAAGWKAGMYFVSTTTGGITTTSKVICVK